MEYFPDPYYANPFVFAVTSPTSTPAPQVPPLILPLHQLIPPPPQIPPYPMNQFQPRGAVDLPIVGTKGAPKKFKGKSNEVESFLHHYEKLCAKWNVTSANDRIQNITQYCSRPVREFLEGLTSYTSSDWAKFKKDFKEFFNADRDDQRFCYKDLEKFTTTARRKHSIKDLATWRKYSRELIRIAGWLYTHGKIDNKQYDTFFWIGIPYAFRERLEHCLMGQDPTHDMSKPFDREKVEAVAKALLCRDRFDREHLASDEDDSDSEAEEEDSISESEREERHSKKKKWHSKKVQKSKKKRVRFIPGDESEVDNSSDEETKAAKRKHKHAHVKTPTPSPPVEPQSEIDQLVDQLSRLSVSDPAYASLLFQSLSS